MRRMLQDVTVIIPAHNRPGRLRRLLDYYSGTGINILVPDSSAERFVYADSYSNVVYRHYPGMHFLLKIQAILPLISTSYVLYCADDDFAVPEGIEQMATFLSDHPDYSIAQGHYLTFTERGGQISFYPRYIRNFDKRITGDTPRERLLQEKDMYASLLYGVVRTDAFRKIYTACFDENGVPRFRNLFLAEEYFNHAALILGKYATLPYFYSARERIAGSATDTTIPVKVIKTTPAYLPEYRGFLTALAVLLSEADGCGYGFEEAFSFMREISDMPKESAVIARKRQILDFVRRSVMLRWLNRLGEWRYHQKGLERVAGMPSYPCTFSTPEKDAIIAAINSTASCER